MIDAFVSVASWFAESLVKLWNMLLGWGTVGALTLAFLLFRRLVRLVGKLIKR